MNRIDKLFPMDNHPIQVETRKELPLPASLSRRFRNARDVWLRGTSADKLLLQEQGLRRRGNLPLI